MRARAVIGFTLLSWILVPWIAFGDVYLLDDGREVAGRTISKRKGSTIRVETLQGVVNVSPEEVDRFLSQREMVKEFRKREKSLDRRKGRDVAELAAWCRQNGLYKEMFELYDMLSILDPDNLSYKAFVNEMTRSIRFKELDVESNGNSKKGFLLLKRMARSGRTFRAIGENLLAAVPRPCHEEVMLKGLKSSDARTQIATLDIASRQRHAILLEEMIKLAICEKNGSVRLAAQNTLLSYEQDGILRPFVQALKSKKKEYRLNALDALALFKDPRTASALIENLKHASNIRHPRLQGRISVGNSVSVLKGSNGHVGSRSGIASPVVEAVSEGSTLKVNVLAISKPVIKNGERKRIAEVLQIITGVDYGEDFLLWNEWWNNNQEKILSKKP